jgi:hypothetical protein
MGKGSRRSYCAVAGSLPSPILSAWPPAVSVITRRRALSLGIAAAAVALASAPLPGLRRPLLVAVGSELEQPLQQLEPLFERRHPGIDLLWQVTHESGAALILITHNPAFAQKADYRYRLSEGKLWQE